MRKEKGYLLNEISKRMFHEQGFVLINYKSLSANYSVKLRAQLRSVGAICFVSNKRILRKAAEKKGVSFDLSMMQGNVAMVSAETDFLQVVKKLFALKEEFKGTFDVLGGYYESAICTASDMELVSKLPTLDEMRARFLGLLQAPMQQTLGAMQSLLSAVPNCLNNRVADLEKD